MEFEKQTCEVCENKCWVLYPLIFGRDHFLTPRKGVCRKCFDKAEELDAIVLKKSKKIIEDSIKEKEESIKDLQEELDKLLKVKEETTT